MTVRSSPQRATGQTRDTGFQIGVRRTLPLDLDAAWRLVTSPAGMAAWLGGEAGLERGRGYRLHDGSTGEMRVVEPASHLRLTWQPGNWPRASTIQLRVLPASNGTTIALHQEHIPDADERERRRIHFAAALDELARIAAEGA